MMSFFGDFCVTHPKQTNCLLCVQFPDPSSAVVSAISTAGRSRKIVTPSNSEMVSEVNGGKSV